jgi:hypothetical protein
MQPLPSHISASILLFFLLVMTNVSLAQEPLDVPKVDKLVFDGKLEENFWKKLSTFSFVQFQPTYKKESSQKLEVYLVYDEDYLYLTGRLYVSDPDYIRGQSFKRDADNPSTDYFGIVIDTYNDKENGLGFFTSPTGLRWDAEINNDATGDNSIGVDWNAYWDVLTTQTNEYYDVELRIPWSTLKFKSTNDECIMGISIWRYIAALNETSQFPDISPDLGEMANWKPSLFQEVKFKGIQSKNPLYITPYVLLGNQRQNTLNDSESQFDYKQEFNANAGLDVKYNLTSNLTMDVTVNTDFAQVESDDEQINLTRYQLFRPEKRQFFQERANLFDFRFNYVNHLFYSRNIGIKDGEAVPILGGVRLTGKIGKMDIGALNMQTAKAGSSFIQGLAGENLSENFSVLRVKQNVFNQYSYVGAMLTHKMDFNGEFNTGYGLDGVFRLWGNEYLTLKWAQTFEDGVEKKPFSLEPTRFFIGWTRRDFAGFSYDINVGSTGSDYNPEMGFVSRSNYFFGNARLQYGILFGEKSHWQTMSFYLSLWADNNYSIGKFDQSSSQIGISMQSKTAWSYNFSLQQNYDYLTEELSFSDEVIIPAGAYWHRTANANVTTPYNARSGIATGLKYGKFFDGDFFAFEVDPRWNPGPHFELHAAYEFKHLNFKEREQTLISHILRLRALYMLSAQFSVSAFIQYNNDSNLFISNVKLRYNPKEGNDLYIVFNEVLNGDRERMLPYYPLLNTEVLALKYTYTFKL